MSTLLGVALIACGESSKSPVEPAFDRETAGASFDWSMPSRFGGDQDGDGLVDYLRTQEEINPASWTVNFDACSNPPGTLYKWYVDKRQVAQVTTCQWSYAFPAEGQYLVELQVTRDTRPTWVEQVVTVQDWLIVSFGDSYASGEGVPEIPAANDALVAAVDAALTSLQQVQANVAATREDLDEAQANLVEALEAKGLAESILQTQQQRLNAFLAACTDIENWSDVLECAQFLAGLPFDTYASASAHFHQAVADAQERVTSLTQAYNAALSAFNSAENAWQSAVNTYNNLQLVLTELQDGLGEAVWQAPYPTENWDGDNCHRSANAAPARAALALEQSDDRTSVTFVHFACTGATIDRHRARMQQQIPWAEALIGPREIDAVLLSIGGNDAGFANIATACVLQQDCYDDEPAFNPGAASGLCTLIGFTGFGAQCTSFFAAIPSESAKLLVEEGVAALPDKYQELAESLFPQLTGLLASGAGEPADRVRSGRVYISEYIDMTKDDAGAYCTQDPNNLLGTIPAVTPDELAWLDVSAAGSINGAVSAAAAAHGWNKVGGIYPAYATHGYCADNHWVIRAYETFLIQGDEKGMAHPNLVGHAHNGQAIYNSLLPSLYPNGVGGVPRSPDTAAP